MSFGMAVFDADGSLGFSSDDVTWNQVAMLYCAAGASINASYPVLSGRDVLVVQIMVNPPPMNRRAIANTITVTGTLVSVSGGNEDTYIMILMR